VAGNILDFGPGALQKTNVNDFAPGTLFSSMVFEDSGYTLNGNAIRLSGGIKTTGTVSGTDSVALSLTLNGTTAGTGYDQLASTGTVSLGGATLNVSLGSFTPPSGSSFTIITRSSADAGNTTFAGLAEGATVTVGGTTFKITYVGGTGHHDVVLTVL